MKPHTNLKIGLGVIMVLLAVLTDNLFAAGGDMGGTDPNGSPEHPYLIEDLDDFDVFADPANAATYWDEGVHTQLAFDPNLVGRSYTTAVIAPDTSSSIIDYHPMRVLM